MKNNTSFVAAVQVGKLRNVVKSKLLSRFPNVRNKILDSLLGALKRADNAPLPAVVKQTDLTKQEWNRMVKKRGYDKDQMKRMLDGDFTGDDIRLYTRNGVQLGDVRALYRMWISKNDINHYVTEGVNLDVVKQAVARKSFDPEDIRWFVNNGDKAYTSKLQKKLGIEGDTGASLRQVVKLDAQDVPVDHIKWFVENGVSLKLVSFLAKRVDDPTRIKRGIRLFGAGQMGAEALGIGADISSWCQSRARNTPGDAVCGI